MQPIHGRLCTFWLTALASAMENAATLEQAWVPMLQVSATALSFVAL